MKCVAGILLILMICVALVSSLSCGYKSYTVTGEELSISVGSEYSASNPVFSIYPAKVLVSKPTQFLVSIHNTSSEPITVFISSRKAIITTEGYTETSPLSSYYTAVPFGSVYIAPGGTIDIPVSVLSRRYPEPHCREESWISFSTTQGIIERELCLRVLIDIKH